MLIWFMVYLSCEIFTVFAMTSHTGFVAYLKKAFQNSSTWMLALGTSLIVLSWLYAMVFRHFLRKYIIVQLIWLAIFLFGLCLDLGELNTTVNPNYYVMATGNVQFVPMIFAFYPCIVKIIQTFGLKCCKCTWVKDETNFDFISSSFPYHLLAFCDFVLIFISFATNSFCAIVIIAIIISFIIGLYIIYKSRSVMQQVEPHETLYASILVFRIF